MRLLNTLALVGAAVAVLGVLTPQTANADSYCRSYSYTRTVGDPIALGGMTTTVERVVERPVVIERTVSRPVTIEKVVERPVYIDRIVEKPVMVDRVIEKPVMIDRVIEKPVMIDRVIEKPVMIDRVIDRPVIIRDRSHAVHVGLFDLFSLGLL